MNEARLAALLPVGTNKFKLAVVSGTVAKTNTWSETHVSGGGGSSVVIGGYGAGGTQAIKSDVTTNREVWLKGEDGKDYHFVMAGRAGTAMEGQRLTVVYMVDLVKNANGKDVVIVRNHAQDEVNMECTEKDLAERHAPGAVCMMAGGWLGALVSGIFGIMNHSNQLMLICLGCLAAAIAGSFRMMTLKQHYRKKLADMAAALRE